jgi:DNA repair exonuclease SbcCD ATPase subunit
MWTMKQLEINGGFLPGLKIALPHGLICIIGPRGSGKSTLAEALRFAVKGAVGVSKKRLDLLQANVGNNVLVTLMLTTDAGLKHTLRRGIKQPAVLLTGEGRPVSGVDLDRGTYLPIDAYNGDEIESIADQVLGETRRVLLDELRGQELSAIHLSLGEHRRVLDANAGQIRAARRTIGDLAERIEEFGDVRARLDALEPVEETGPAIAHNKALKQQQRNTKEKNRVEDCLQTLESLKDDAEDLKSRIDQARAAQIAQEDSPNSEVLQCRQPEVQKSLSSAVKHLTNAAIAIDAATATADQVRAELAELHAKQAAEFTELQKVHAQADARSRERLNELTPLIQRLKQWRTDNEPTHAQAINVFKEQGVCRLPWTLSKTGKLAGAHQRSLAVALSDFLKRHSKIRALRGGSRRQSVRDNSHYTPSPVLRADAVRRANVPHVIYHWHCNLCNFSDCQSVTRNTAKIGAMNRHR